MMQRVRFSLAAEAASKLLIKHPILVNCFTGFTIFTIGDVMSQKIPDLVLKPQNEEKLKIDFRRALLFGSLGCFMNGFALRSWYIVLEKVAGSSMKSNKTVGLKMLLDQLVYAPFSITMYFGFASYLEVKKKISPDVLSPTEISKELVVAGASNWFDTTNTKLETHLFSTWLADCAIWPIANFINFKYVPLSLRPSFISCVQVVWQAYLSMVSTTVVAECPDSNASEVDISNSSSEVQVLLLKSSVAAGGADQ